MYGPCHSMHCPPSVPPFGYPPSFRQLLPFVSRNTKSREQFTQNPWLNLRTETIGAIWEKEQKLFTKKAYLPPMTRTNKTRNPTPWSIGQLLLIRLGLSPTQDNHHSPRTYKRHIRRIQIQRVHLRSAQGTKTSSPGKTKYKNVIHNKGRNSRAETGGDSKMKVGNAEGSRRAGDFGGERERSA